MAYRACQFIGGCSREGHVRNKVGYFAHLQISSGHNTILMAVSIVMLFTITTYFLLAAIFHFRIEANQPLKSWTRGNPHSPFPIMCWNTHNCIAIKIRTGQTLCNFTVNTDSVDRGFTDQLNSFWVFISYRQNRYLECASMWIPNERKLTSRCITRSIHFSITKCGNWKYYMIFLSWKRRSLKINRCCIT